MNKVSEVQYLYFESFAILRKIEDRAKQEIETKIKFPNEDDNVDQGERRPSREPQGQPGHGQSRGRPHALHPHSGQHIILSITAILLV